MLFFIILSLFSEVIVSFSCIHFYINIIVSENMPSPKIMCLGAIGKLHKKSCEHLGISLNSCWVLLLQWLRKERVQATVVGPRRSGWKGRDFGPESPRVCRDNHGGWSTGSRWTWRSFNGTLRKFLSCRRRR